MKINDKLPCGSSYKDLNCIKDDGSIDVYKYSFHVDNCEECDKFVIDNVIGIENKLNNDLPRVFNNDSLLPCGSTYGDVGCLDNGVLNSDKFGEHISICIKCSQSVLGISSIISDCFDGDEE